MLYFKLAVSNITNHLPNCNIIWWKNNQHFITMKDLQNNFQTHLQVSVKKIDNSHHYNLSFEDILINHQL